MNFLSTAAFLILTLAGSTYASEQKSIVIVHSEMGRGDVLYSQMYGHNRFDSNGNQKVNANVLIECKKTFRGEVPSKPSYITVKDRNQGINILSEISLEECLNLYEIVNNATQSSPVEFIIQDGNIIDIIK